LLVRAIARTVATQAFQGADKEFQFDPIWAQLDRKDMGLTFAVLELNFTQEVIRDSHPEYLIQAGTDGVLPEKRPDFLYL